MTSRQHSPPNELHLIQSHQELCTSIENIVWLAQPCRSTYQPNWPLCWPFWNEQLLVFCECMESNFTYPATHSLPTHNKSFNNTAFFSRKKNTHRATISLQTQMATDFKSDWYCKDKTSPATLAKGFWNKKDTLMFVNISNCKSRRSREKPYAM